MIIHLLRTRHNHYFVKMASSQRHLHCSGTGKTIHSQTKHVVMNLWNYFDREAKKSGRQGNLMEKVALAYW